MRKRPKFVGPKAPSKWNPLSPFTFRQHPHYSVVCLFKRSYTPHSLSKSCKAISHDKQTYYYYQRCCRVGFVVPVCVKFSLTLIIFFLSLSFTRKRKGKKRKTKTSCVGLLVFLYFLSPKEAQNKVFASEREKKE